MKRLLLPILSEDAACYVRSVTGGSIDSIDLSALNEDQRELLATVLEAELTCVREGTCPGTSPEKGKKLAEAVQTLSSCGAINLSSG